MECCCLGQNREASGSLRQGGDRALERGDDWKISPAPCFCAEVLSLTEYLS